MILSSHGQVHIPLNIPKKKKTNAKMHGSKQKFPNTKPNKHKKLFATKTPAK
jgi:hypothetical protein